MLPDALSSNDNSFRRMLARLRTDMKTGLLRIAFGATVLLRFLYPFFHNPADQQFASMLRHIGNGETLFNPNFYNGLEAKGFQVWMFLLEWISGVEFRSFAALITGLLCAGMAWFWYKALREMMPRRPALGLSVLLGLHPSLLIPYGYFVPETLMLALIPLSVWMSLRAVRRESFPAFALAALCWMAALFTKTAVMPLAFIGVGYALSRQTRKSYAVAFTTVLFLVFLLPASLQSLVSLHMAAPFGLTEMHTALRKSDRLALEFNIFNAHDYSAYGWTPKVFCANPYDPLFSYVTGRAAVPYVGALNSGDARNGWEAILRDIDSRHSWRNTLNEYQENFSFLFFAPALTEMRVTEPFCAKYWSGAYFPHPTFLLDLNYYILRWLWFPAFLLILLCGPWTRLPPEKMWVVAATIFTTAVFLLQDISVIEGEDRKIIEPFLLLGFFFLLEAVTGPPAAARLTSLRRFVLDVYIRPLLLLVLNPLQARKSTPPSGS